MQNKGFVRLFAILLALVSAYQLSFTFVTRNIEEDAAAYAQGDQMKEYTYLDSMGSVVVYDLGIVDYTYRECKSLELNLGLDLKGGMNVMLEVSVPDIVKALANNSNDETFVKAMAQAKAELKNSQKDFITLFADAFQTIDPGARMAAVFNTLELKDKISYTTSNEDVIKIIRAEAKDAIDNSFLVLRTRIDRFGVAQPNIQKVGLESSGRILVELPGVKDVKRVRSLLQGTANLEFWETYEYSEVYSNMLEANNIIREINEAKAVLEKAAETVEGTVEETEPADAVTETAKDEFADLLGDSAMQDSASVANQMNFEKANPLFAVLYPNLTSDRQNVQRGPVVGIAHYKDTATVNKYLSLPQVKAVMPRDLDFKWTSKAFDEKEEMFQLLAIKITSRDGRAPLDGDAIADARADFGQNQASNAEVDLSMTADGAKVWARLTGENEGRSIAIVLDNYVRSFPTVNEKITGGRSQITGNFTVEEAKDLANVLKSGKMPAPAHIMTEDVVGPSLGQEAIDSGLFSFIIAFIVVLLYMIFYYGVIAGLVADTALIANLFFIMGVLASFGAVLTLPGIAGIILTIGTSVDANVLIYERIREELKAGKGIKKAIADGYNNAFSAIIDANVTTFLTGFILYTFGTGPIKGFATTLMIGIATSFFTAIFLTRIIFEQILKKDRELKFDTSITRKWFEKTAINFIGKRKIFYAISSVIVLLGIVSLLLRGMDQGIDFTGGRTYVVRFDETVSTVDVQNALKEAFNGDIPDVKTFGDDNQVRIGTNYEIDNEDPEIDDKIEALMYEGLKDKFPLGNSLEDFKDNHIMSSQKVGPTIADDIKKDAVWAILFSLIVIFMYILIRFRNWQYSLGAIVALGHDVLITMGIFSVFYSIMPFSMEIGQSFIAAILTVIGYSINDTVVVFDRIRERIGLYPKRDREVVINRALNSTLSRTLSTSLSTFVVLLTVFLFGGEVIRGFIFALIVGVVVGTYSSLFVATPVAYDTQRLTSKKKE